MHVVHEQYTHSPLTTADHILLLQRPADIREFGINYTSCQRQREKTGTSADHGNMSGILEEKTACGV